MSRQLVIILTLAIIILTLNNAAAAQGMGGQLSISPFAGLGMPLGILHDNDFDSQNAMFRADGLRFGINAEYFLADRFSLGVDFSYADYGSRELISDNPEFDGLKPNDKMRIMLFGIHARHFLSIRGRAKPYVLLGFGFHDIALKNWNVRPAVEENNYKLSSRPFMQGAFGVQVHVNPKMSLFGEAGLTYLLTKDASISLNGTNLVDPNNGHAVEIKKNYYIFNLSAGLNFWFNI